MLCKILLITVMCKDFKTQPSSFKSLQRCEEGPLAFVHKLQDT